MAKKAPAPLSGSLTIGLRTRSADGNLLVKKGALHSRIALVDQVNVGNSMCHGWGRSRLTAQLKISGRRQVRL